MIIDWPSLLLGVLVVLVFLFLRWVVRPPKDNLPRL
jgi:hypothetical protein